MYFIKWEGMRRIIKVSLLLLCFNVNAEDKNGSLAIDRDNGFYYGWSNNASTQEEANKKALKECKNKGGNCHIVLQFKGPGCAAYRTIDGEVGTAYGWGVGTSKIGADKIAAFECKQRSEGEACTNSVWLCNSDNIESNMSSPSNDKSKYTEVATLPEEPSDKDIDITSQLWEQHKLKENYTDEYYSHVYKFIEHTNGRIIANVISGTFYPQYFFNNGSRGHKLKEHSAKSFLMECTISGDLMACIQYGETLIMWQISDNSIESLYSYSLEHKLNKIRASKKSIISRVSKKGLYLHLNTSTKFSSSLLDTLNTTQKKYYRPQAESVFSDAFSLHAKAMESTR
jgi:hypothetical protein